MYRDLWKLSKQSLVKLSNDEVVVKIIHGGVGAINESDVSLASASNAIIIGFNVRPDATAKETAEREERGYPPLPGDLQRHRRCGSSHEGNAGSGIRREGARPCGSAADCSRLPAWEPSPASYVWTEPSSGTAPPGSIRDGIVVYEGSLASLKRFKDDVKEVRAGYECGFVFNNFNDVKEGDQVEAYKMVEVPR